MPKSEASTSASAAAQADAETHETQVDTGAAAPELTAAVSGDEQPDEGQEGGDDASEVGDDDGEEDEEEEGDDGQPKASGSAEPQTAQKANPPLPNEAPPGAAPPDTKGWQAVWEPNYRAYYFYNARTGVTTWENPLVGASGSGSGGDEAATSASAAGPSGTSSSPSADLSISHIAALDPLAAAAAAQGIDPDLAYLDPGRFRAASSAATGGAGAPSLSGHFDARTGRFVPAPLASARDPGSFSDVERSKRLAAHYFDQEAWEKERDEERRVKRAREEEGAAGEQGKKWKSKREREEIRKRQAAKKEKKHAWLRT